MKIKEKYKKILLDIKNQAPETIEKLLNKIPPKVLIKFFITTAKEDQILMLYQDYDMRNMTVKKELLAKAYYKKYRKNIELILK